MFAKQNIEIAWDMNRQITKGAKEGKQIFLSFVPLPSLPPLATCRLNLFAIVLTHATPYRTIAGSCCPNSANARTRSKHESQWAQGTQRSPVASGLGS